MKELKFCRIDKFDPIEVDGKVERENSYLIDLATYDDTDLWTRLCFDVYEHEDGAYFVLTDVLSYGYPDLHIKSHDDVVFWSKNKDFIVYVENNEAEVIKEVFKYIRCLMTKFDDLYKDVSRLSEEAGNEQV